MGKGSKGGRAKPRGEAAEQPPEDLLRPATVEKKKAEPRQPELPQQVEEEDKRTKEELEACFMRALEKHMGGLEMTEENVRKVLLAMPPEQQRALAEEGDALKRQLLQKKENEKEAALFRAEMNKNAEERGLPTEADGEHLTKKVIAFLNGGTAESIGPIPNSYVLAALASSPYLVKLAVADAKASEIDAKALNVDLDAIEARLCSLDVEGFRASDDTTRPPFVRRTLLLLLAHLYSKRMGDELKVSETTVRAQKAVVARTTKLAEMLYRYSLHNRWVKAALTTSELLALLTNGLWDVSDPDCKAVQAARMTEVGLKMPKLKMAVSATDARPGQKVTVKAEVYRLHVYDEKQAAEIAADSEAASAAMEKAAAERAAKGQPSGATPLSEPTEGWWLIGEAVRGDGLALGGTPIHMDEGTKHNALVGCVPLAVSTKRHTRLHRPITFPTSPIGSF
mmetsp:Transcript_13713/g.41750  ORF Transcript_13713/g.41750 Transcript_13713/m.41750 type:complete len:453 (-) Transcript_13713:746-2104(-)